MSESAHKAARLKPISSPTELREATVNDYARNLQRMGVSVDRSLLERQATSDLELTESAKRGQDASPNYKVARAPKREAAQAALFDDGLLKRRNRQTGAKLKNWLNAPAGAIDEKWGYMMGRLTRIAAGAGASSNMIQSYSSAEIPKLALEFRRVISSYMLRHRRVKHNPFTTATGSILNERDAFRKLRMLLEQICDASTGSTMGPWWVPK